MLASHCPWCGRPYPKLKSELDEQKELDEKRIQILRLLEAKTGNIPRQTAPTGTAEATLTGFDLNRS
jgi:hypothetical protein